MPENLTTNDLAKSSRLDPPCALLRGSIWSGWSLHDLDGTKLADFWDDRSAPYDHADEWCKAHGYYRSGWSDADDRPGAVNENEPETI